MRGNILVLFCVCVIAQSINIHHNLIKRKINLLNKQKIFFTNYNTPKFKQVENTNLKEESVIDYSSILNDIIVLAQNETSNNTNPNNNNTNDTDTKDSEKSNPKNDSSQSGSGDNDGTGKSGGNGVNPPKETTGSDDDKDKNTLLIVCCVGGGVILLLIIIIIIVGVKNKSAYSKLQSEVNKISFKDNNKNEAEDDDDKEDTLT